MTKLISLLCLALLLIVANANPPPLVAKNLAVNGKTETLIDRSFCATGIRATIQKMNFLQKALPKEARLDKEFIPFAKTERAFIYNEKQEKRSTEKPANVYNLVFTLPLTRKYALMPYKT